MAKFCEYCGNKLEDDEKVCTHCGKSLSKSQNTDNNQKAYDFFAKNRKYLMIIIPVIIILCVVMAFVVFSGADTDSFLVNVTGVTLDHEDFYVNSIPGGKYEERPIKCILNFSFVPKENIDNVTGIGVQNVKFTYANGMTDDVKSSVFKTHENTYISGSKYSCSFVYLLQLYLFAEDNIEAFFDTTHVSGDIVVNTTFETNKVIGHIDEDVIPPGK